MNTPKHVFLVDDNADVRLHVGNLLLRLGYAVEVFDRATHLMERERWPEWSVVLMDMRMPQATGVEALRAMVHALERQGGCPPVVFISGESQPQEIIDAMKLGAVDFLIKPVGAVELKRALDQAFEVGRDRVLRHQRRQRAEAALAALSPRERGVLPLLLQGHSNRSAAQVLCVQADTVKKHRAAILEKLMLEDLTGLIALFEGLDLPDATGGFPGAAPTPQP